MKRNKRGYTPHWRPQTRSIQVKRRKRRRAVLSVFLLLLLLFLLLAGILFFTPIGSKRAEGAIYIREETTTAEVASRLREQVSLSSKWLFSRYAKLVGLEKSLRKGRYCVDGGMSYYAVLKKLIRESQDPVVVSFSSVRTQKELVEKLTTPLALSSEELQKLLSNPEFCASKGFDTTTIRCLFLPNSYEVYWTVSAEELVEKCYKHYQAFWNDKRKKQAQREGLSPIEISIIASIVEEESNKTDEYSRIAGLYINRLRRGMLLQADPTVKYALGNFSLRRISSSHTLVDSPYNTYQVKGLPPGPIRFPSEKTIDSVLSFEKHAYLYMCAKSDFSGYHSFATSYGEHLANAYRYQKALDARGIKAEKTE